jgi:hypothetical protein
MAPFLFRCPRTGLKVQGFVAEDVSDLADDAIVPVTCHACGGLHLVNPKAETAENGRET